MLELLNSGLKLECEEMYMFQGICFTHWRALQTESRFWALYENQVLWEGQYMHKSQRVYFNMQRLNKNVLFLMFARDKPISTFSIVHRYGVFCYVQSYQEGQRTWLSIHTHNSNWNENFLTEGDGSMPRSIPRVSLDTGALFSSAEP